jgi:D-alanyl-D-alanine endopeptidase (penicillin-binding protein 7)
MTRIKSLNLILLVLAGVLFFSTGEHRMIQFDTSELEAAVDNRVHFNYDHIKKGPYLNLKSAMLVDYDNGRVLYAKNADRVRPIASISKLVMAMVVLDKGLDLHSKTETITKADAKRSSRSRLKVGTKMSLYDLLHSALMVSDNRAARALARATSGSIKAFAREMNRKAQSLGLKNTKFIEPSGLDQRNVSTATEVAKLLHHAQGYDLISSITSKKKHTVRFLNRKKYTLSLGNTNRLIWSPYWVLAGKTGYIQASDYCLTSLVRNKEGERLALVVLGVPGDKLRFQEAQKLLSWGFRRN